MRKAAACTYYWVQALQQMWFYSRVVIDPSPLFFRSGVLGKSFGILRWGSPVGTLSCVFCFLGQSEWEAPWLYSLLANIRCLGFSRSYFCLHQRGKEALKSLPLQMQYKLTQASTFRLPRWIPQVNGWQWLCNKKLKASIRHCWSFRAHWSIHPI